MEEHSNTQRTPYLFTAKELDEETGLYYFGARYYDPRTSVWQSPDPILASYMGGSPNGGVFNPMNLGVYTYSQNRPVILLDPDGRSSCASGGGMAVIDTASNTMYCQDTTFWQDHPLISSFIAGPVALFNRHDGIAVNPLSGYGLSPKEEMNEKVGLIIGLIPAGKGVEAGSRLSGLIGKATSWMVGKFGRAIPHGLTSGQFSKLSTMVRSRAGELGLGGDIFVHGSRASGRAGVNSDIDIAIRVNSEKFDAILANSKLGNAVPGSAKSRTQQYAAQNGIIQRGELGLSGFGRQLEREIGMDVDISVIRAGGPFDTGPRIPLE